jgi:hypothetical protein
MVDRMTQEDEQFWAEAPDHRWLFEWAGWPKGKPRHSSERRGWRLQLLLSIVMCVGLAISLHLIH